MKGAFSKESAGVCVACHMHLRRRQVGFAARGMLNRGAGGAPCKAATAL